MGKVITQLSVAMLMATCSTGYSAMQESPAVVRPATGHYGSVVSVDGVSYFIVTIGGAVSYFRRLCSRVTR